MQKIQELEEWVLWARRKSTYVGLINPIAVGFIRYDRHRSDRIETARFVG